MVFQDKDFPANDDSLGKLSAASYFAADGEEIKWMRLPELLSTLDQSTQGDWDSACDAELFKDGVKPDDIAQGMIGNCWLVSAFACVAQACPELIEERFAAPRDAGGRACLSKDGRYVVQLWCCRRKRWENVVIDDHIPVVCDGATGEFKSCLGASPNGPEGWVVLLEKAFAKFMGSYSAIEGGYSLSAFQALAGNQQSGAFSYVRNPVAHTWLPHKAVMEPVAKTKAGLTVRDHRMVQTADARPLCDIEMFQRLRKWRAEKGHKFLFGAGTTAGSDKDETEGIFHGHAYSLLNAVPVPGFTMVHVANPHGCGEWRGPWCDGHALWDEHPEVAKACGYGGPKDDGMFWMQVESFTRHFDQIDVLRLDGGLDFRLSEADLASSADVTAPGGGEEDLPDFDDYAPSSGGGDDDDDLTEDDIMAVLTQVFESFDGDGSGALDVAELRAALRNLLNHTLPRPLVEELLTLVGGRPRDGAALQHLRAIVELAPFVEKFVEMDVDGNRQLGTDEVMQLLQELGVMDGAQGQGWLARRSARKDVKRIVAQFDDSRDGRLSLSEFCGMMQALQVAEE